MSLEIQWNDIDPESGRRRYLRAERFAGVWSFKFKLQRRGDWTRGLQPTREMWEHILDALRRRFQRPEGVTEDDIAQVERILAELPEEP